GVLKVFPVLIFLVPGLIGFALNERGLLEIPLQEARQEAAAAQQITETTAEPMIDGDRVFATLVTGLLPVGLRGLVVAGLLAALMSSLSSLFNSSASLFTIDIYERLRPGMSERHLVNVGRIATTAVVGLGLLWKIG